MVDFIVIAIFILVLFKGVSRFITYIMGCFSKGVFGGYALALMEQPAQASASYAGLGQFVAEALFFGGVYLVLMLFVDALNIGGTSMEGFPLIFAGAALFFSPFILSLGSKFFKGHNTTAVLRRNAGKSYSMI